MSRRDWFKNGIIWVALGLSYGLFALFALRFLRPLRTGKPKNKMFVGFAEDLREGGLPFETPKGERYILTKGTQGLRAFSSRCPHLGCKVHWEAQASRFFCPCHEGVFDPAGKAIAGPPAKAGQSLKTCEILQQGRAIYALVDA